MHACMVVPKVDPVIIISLPTFEYIYTFFFIKKFKKTYLAMLTTSGTFSGLLCPQILDAV